MKFYIDFEATRFSQRIISIGCVAENGACFHTLVKPVNDDKVDNFITKLTGITNEMLMNAPSADEAFNNWFDWVISNSNNTVPEYVCYGNSDANFIDCTVKYMSDVRAITFAISLRSLLSDYSKVANKYLQVSSIGLHHIYTIMKTDAEEQHHDAMEDALMLKYVVENLQDKCKPEDIQKVEYQNISPRPEKKRAAEFFKQWPLGNAYKYMVDTFATADNWVIKAEDGENVKYFDSMNTAVLWAMRYCCLKGKSPKRASDIQSVMACIGNSIKSETVRYAGCKWYANGEVRE